MKLALRWSHARRNFIEAKPAYPQASGAIDILRKLFAIEKTLPDFRYVEDRAERKHVLETICATRDEQSRPLVEQLKTWMGQQSCLPKSPFALAPSIYTFSISHSTLETRLERSQVPMFTLDSTRLLLSGPNHTFFWLFNRNSARHRS